MSDFPAPLSLDFDENRAEAYDHQFTAGQPVKDNLHFLMQIIFRDLPSTARILCAGAGTGAEAIALAAAFPDWHFTLVDPSSAMLKVARRRTDAAGVSARCSFHAGFVSSLPDNPAFDAATSILVSHFITDTNERQAYYASILARLKFGGVFVNADIAGDRAAFDFEALMDTWLGFYELSGIPPEGRKAFPEMLGRAVAVHTPRQVENLIEAAGFTPPVAFFQSLLIRGWFARKPG